MRKFGSIEQFRHVVNKVTHRATYVGQSSEDLPLYNEALPKPVLTFSGTTKLHGTNTGVGFDLKSGSIDSQGHYRSLSIDNDQSGFCAWVQGRKTTGEPHFLKEILEALYEKSEAGKKEQAAQFFVYGEWCGVGVNSKTGVGKLPNSWFVFSAVAISESGEDHWFDPVMVAAAWRKKTLGDGVEDSLPSVSKDIYFLSDFKRWSIDIDFNDPGHVIEELERLTLEVENECPVALSLGISGIGEGIVWVCDDPRYGRLVFKTKGDKHKGTKNANLITVAPEVIAGRDEFVQAVLTENRLEQGFEFFKSQYGKVTSDHIGDFLSWVGKDVLKEESDSLKASGLDRKLVMGEVNKKAKLWLMPRLAKF